MKMPEETSANHNQAILTIMSNAIRFATLNTITFRRVFFFKKLFGNILAVTLGPKNNYQA